MEQNIVMRYFFRKLFKWNFSEQNVGNIEKKCENI